MKSKKKITVVSIEAVKKIDAIVDARWQEIVKDWAATFNGELPPAEKEQVRRTMIDLSYAEGFIDGMRCARKISDGIFKKHDTG